MLNFPDSSKDLHKYIANKLLENVYPEEAENIAKILMHEMIGISTTDLILNKKIELLEKKQKELESAIIRLVNNEPVQYILNNAHFYGRDFYVDKNVLIPRPETEELVDWIKMTFDSPGTILDIGTGSGCIAISLAGIFPDAQVVAIDSEVEAIKVAEKNAKANHINIDFLVHDILKMTVLPGKFDVIVSNPPYIPQSDKNDMQENVLKYEPGSALFVSNDDSLIFYRKICELSAKFLHPNGKLFFEIHEERGNEIMNLMRQFNFKNVALKKDLQGKDRMVRGSK